MTAESTSKPRLQSLDQFRGYTVFGMLLVNFFGGYAACPQVWLHKHDYCSYADTIMPQFLFAVGFSLRLTTGRLWEADSKNIAYGRIVRRLLGLVLIALIIYTIKPKWTNWAELTELGFWKALSEPLKRQWFQTLTHIAATSLWILPVIHRSIQVRMIWMAISAAAHVYLSYRFNFVWCNSPPNVIDGGPLGFLTWTIPAIIGTVACDLFVPAKLAAAKPIVPSASIRNGLLLALSLALCGYLFSCATRFYDVIKSESPATNERLASSPVLPTSDQLQTKLTSSQLSDWFAEPPFVSPPPQEKRQWNYWMMSQRTGTLSYLTFAAGFSLLVFIAFYVVCDRLGFSLPLFQTFGTNALAAYIIHDIVSSAVSPFFPKDSPTWFAWSGLALFLVINWMVIRALEKQKIFLKV